jgi:hypothetical protein
MKIRLTLDGKRVEATLLDNATARDFLSLLPITLTLEDCNATRRSATRRGSRRPPALPLVSILP